MKRQTSDLSVQIGELLEESPMLSLDELCRHCSIELDYVVSLVREGVLEAAGEDPSRWRFQVNSVRRLRTVRRLQRDLGVNLAGAALALELLDRIAALERRMSFHG